MRKTRKHSDDYKTNCENNDSPIYQPDAQILYSNTFITLLFMF